MGFRHRHCQSVISIPNYCVTAGPILFCWRRTNDTGRWILRPYSRTKAVICGIPCTLKFIPSLWYPKVFFYRALHCKLSAIFLSLAVYYWQSCLSGDRVYLNAQKPACEGRHRKSSRKVIWERLAMQNTTKSLNATTNIREVTYSLYNTGMKEICTNPILQSRGRRDINDRMWLSSCFKYRYYQLVLSNSSFASLIFVAKYGLPPRSGWLRSISCRWFLRTFSLVSVRSLRIRSVRKFRKHN